jgi:hypothetical protein
MLLQITPRVLAKSSPPVVVFSANSTPMHPIVTTAGYSAEVSQETMLCTLSFPKNHRVFSYRLEWSV